MPPPVLDIRGLSSNSGGHARLNDVTFQVNRGDVVAVTGPSGAGKSTLLRIIVRLEVPSSGNVLLDGQDFTSVKPTELRRRVGLVMQEAWMFPGTVAENVAFGPAQQGRTLGPDEIDRILLHVGLGGYAGRNARQLSGGEAQRVSLARTLANRPEVLLLDEPTSSLDEETRREIETVICDLLRDDGLTALLVTHDLDQARRVANRLLELDAGRVRRLLPMKDAARA